MRPHTSRPTADRRHLMSGPLLVAALSQQAQAELANVYRALARGPLPGQPLLAVEPYSAVPNTYTVPVAC